MSPSSQDAYDQFSEASTTPLWDLAIGLVTRATVLGGGLAGVYGIGYLAVGRAALAWPLLATAAVLVIVNLALRWGASPHAAGTDSGARRNARADPTAAVGGASAHPRDAHGCREFVETRYSHGLGSPFLIVGP